MKKITIFLLFTLLWQSNPCFALTRQEALAILKFEEPNPTDRDIKRRYRRLFVMFERE